MAQHGFASMKTLQALFPKIATCKLALLRALIKREVESIPVADMLGVQPGKHDYLPAGNRSSNILLIADHLLGTFGVETLGHGVYYCNTGETYDATLLYDARQGRFWVGSWGDLVEANPTKFG